MSYVLSESHRARLDQFDYGEINTITFDIPRRQLPAHQLRVGTNKEIRQRDARGVASAGSRACKPISPVRVPADRRRSCGHIKDSNTGLAHIMFDFLSAPESRIQFSQYDRINRCPRIDDGRRNQFSRKDPLTPDAVVRIDNDICVQQNQGSLVNFRSSSQRTFGTLFHFRIAFRTSPLCVFLPALPMYSPQHDLRPLAFAREHVAETAPGSTTRFLLFAVTVIVGLSHMGRCSQTCAAEEKSALWGQPAGGT